jgi:uncharacterized protein (TIGR00730 family)
MNKLRSIAVYCGSSVGNHPVFADDARKLMAHFVNHNIRLVNGGGSIGLMGVMADSIMQLGGQAIGVIPLSLKEKELAHMGMTEINIVPDMHSRKLMMVNLSDAFIGFPGGFGTMDEVFETLTWSQLHLHQKPILLYNPNGFYDRLIDQVDHMTAEGFINAQSRRLLMATDELDQVIPMLRDFSHAVVDNWTY